MKLTHKFAKMTPDKRPQDPHMDGIGAVLDHEEPPPPFGTGRRPAAGGITLEPALYHRR
jgi:hypothetical protein